MKAHLKFIAARSDYGRFIKIDAARELEDGSLEVLNTPRIDRIPEGSALPGSLLQLQPEEAQRLMDALWDCGLRPTEGSGSAGALAATQNHLQDMRALVFKLQEMEVPRG